MLFFSSRTRKSLCLASLAVCFCISPPVASGLTQSEVESAVFSALTRAPLNFTGTAINTVPFLFPGSEHVSPSTLGEYMFYTFGDSGSGTMPEADKVRPALLTIRDTLRGMVASNSVDSVALQQLLVSFELLVSNRLDSAVHSLDNIDSNTGSSAGYLSSIDSSASGSYYYLSQIFDVLAPATFNQSDELLVHDADVLAYLDGMEDDISGVLDTLIGSSELLADWQDAADSFYSEFNSFSGEFSGFVGGFEADMSELLRSVGTVTNILNAEFSSVNQASYHADDEFEDGIESAPDGSTNYDSIDDTAVDDYEDIEMPEVHDDYQPSINPSDLSSSQEDSGLSGVVLPNSHNALVTLIPYSRSAWSPGGQNPIPPVEVDFGRNSELVSGVQSFSSLASTIYTMVFTLLLSVKAIVMFRKVRLATTAIAVDEKSLPITLAYEPF